VIEILHLFISPGHNFFGHHGKPPDDHAILEVDEIECVAGKGIRGDRFFEHKLAYKQPDLAEHVMTPGGEAAKQIEHEPHGSFQEYSHSVPPGSVQSFNPVA
jgi:hypothetical protein